jgi:hypothetical protein
MRAARILSRMIGRCIALAALAVLLLSSGAGATAAGIASHGAALVEAMQDAAPHGCDACDGPEVAGPHCGPFCMSAAAILHAAVAAPALGRAGYNSVPAVAAIAAIPEPDHSPPR